ncbi:hypothetical protein VB776_06990 [Arcicella sp. DC2W]|uniref:Uncharacterized protein n=1 Tax=Arcicella gelida TaxID=2984195 RepID=A0ABU5S2I4_9BACT|nr:hypothetical protein [Arcicella sp. DC2W]MEA5402653.1 hypothetical protein [Arcicella sp. DC2W]
MSELKKVRITYPATVFVSKFIFVEQDKIDEMIDNHELIVDFIYGNMTHEQKDFTEKDSIHSAYTQGYAKLKIL